MTDKPPQAPPALPKAKLQAAGEVIKGPLTLAKEAAAAAQAAEAAAEEE